MSAMTPTAWNMLRTAEREARERLNRRSPQTIAVATLPSRLRADLSALPALRRAVHAAESRLKRAGYNPQSRRGRVAYRYDAPQKQKPLQKLRQLYERAQIDMMKATTPARRATVLDGFRKAAAKLK